MIMKPMKGRKSGKMMNFSQPVLGTSSKRSKKKSVGIIAAPSAGMVTKSPPRKKGKRIY